MKNFMGILLFLVFPATTLPAQVDSIAHYPGFEFREGIYLNFDQFRANRPIPSEKIVSNYPRESSSFLDKVVQNPKIQYYDFRDSLVTVKTSSIWGYSKNSAVYISHGRDFNRIMVMGSICHYSAYIYSPNPIYDPYNLGSNNPNYQTFQFVLDTKTGTSLAFNVTNMEKLLARDPQLYQEFMALKKKKKRNSIFVYLRKYNERNPLFFPNF